MDYNRIPSYKLVLIIQDIRKLLTVYTSGDLNLRLKATLEVIKNILIDRQKVYEH